MLLFAISLAFFWILNLVETFPPKEFKIPFKQRLDTCIKLENSNTKECLSFISTYQWLYDEIHIVFDKILEKENSTDRFPAENILESRLIHLIESPNFDLKSLGHNPFWTAIIRNHEPLAIAVWRGMKTYKNESSDLQLEVCRGDMYVVMARKMLQLLTNMVTDRPDCLKQDRNIFEIAYRLKFGLPMAIFLYDHGAQIGMYDLHIFAVNGDYKDIFELVIRKNTTFLLESILEDYIYLHDKIWNVMIQGNHSNLLLETCNNVIIHAVNYYLPDLLKVMARDFPECIRAKADILMDIAIRGGMKREKMIPFLQERRVEITPALILKDPRPLIGGNRLMIQLLNDIGIEITPEHLQILSTNGDNFTYEWVRLYSQFSRETFINSPIKNDYFKEAINEGHFALTQKILDFNAFKIEEIERFIYSSLRGSDDLLKDYVISRRVTNCNETIFHAVNSNLHFLVKAIHKDFPECILSKGDILMEIAIRGGMNKESLIMFLKERGVEITPGLVLIDSIRNYRYGFLDMILILNDTGVNITPEHLQRLSMFEDTSNFEWASLNSHLSKETFLKSPIKREYFKKAIHDNNFGRIKQILDFNVYYIWEIEEIISTYPLSQDNFLQNYVNGKL